VGSIAIVGVEDATGTFSGQSLARMRAAGAVVVSSASGVITAALAEQGLAPVSLADLGVGPGASTAHVIDALVRLAEERDVAFVSAGYPLLRDGFVTGLLARSGSAVDVLPTISPLNVILMALDVDLTADLDIIDARSLSPTVEQRLSHLIVTGVDNRVLARHVSERLLAAYAPDHTLVLAADHGNGGYELVMSSVEAAADLEPPHGSAVFVPPLRVAGAAGFDGFVRTIATLRVPDGCPWDRAQDHLSLRRNLIEEAYEVLAAIEANDDIGLAEELGDVLLQVVLHAQIAADENRFTIDDVVSGISEKIRRRHPHVFGDATAGTPTEVIERWDEIKRDEKAGESALEGIPASLPALMWAQTISRRAVGAGFEWETLDAVWDKVHEEIDELRATEPGSPEAADEIGDLLFTIVNVARKQGLDAEEALRATCRKFIGRFEHMERSARGAGSELTEIEIEAMERLWLDAKRHAANEKEEQGR